MPLAGIAVIVPPVAVVVALLGVATTKPVGSVFVNTNVVASAVLLVLLMVKVSVTVSPCAIVSAANALLKPGAGLMCRVSLAVALIILLLAAKVPVLLG